MMRIGSHVPCLGSQWWGFAFSLVHHWSYERKKKATVSRSSTEAEYLSIVATACELQWMVYLLQEFQIQQLLLIALHCDNKATQHITANPIFYERTLHLEIDWHIVRNQLSKGFISLVYVASKNHLADLFTKSISSTCLRLLLSKMELPYFNPSQLKGGVKRNVQNDIVGKMWQNDVVFNNAENATFSSDDLFAPDSSTCSCV